MTLSPQPLLADKIQRAISTKRLGKKIHCFKTIPSTNLEAQSLAKKGAAEGGIVIAEEQTQGKGRLGRGWVSPPHLNLYLSVILRPKLPPSLAPQITLMSAVAIADTVQSFLPFQPEIKWPNDILVGGKKIAGVLTESSCEPDRIVFVVVGIGINLNFPRDLMPESIKETATSVLILTQKPVDRGAFTCRLIQSLDQCYGELESGGFASIAQRWDSFFRLRGKSVRVEMPDRRVSGRVVGIDTDGALILAGEGGVRERIVAGDVFPMIDSD